MSLLRRRGILARPATAAPADDYEAAVLADNPVGYWRLGEASGTVAVDVIDTYPGEYVGTHTKGEPALINDTDTAVAFAGGRVRIDGVAAPSVITVEAWVKTTQTGVRSIVGRDNSGTARSFQLRLNGGTAEFLVFTDDPSAVVTAVGTSINDGDPHHVVGTYDGTTVRVYVDGSQAGTAAGGGTFRWGGTEPVLIATRREGTPSDILTGTVDEVALYDSVSTAARVAARYAAGT